ncbi:glycosyl hydrolase family 28-related protein [Heyndrickxia faecalis]|uniref:glycosyl hydrolase family 28-related protein n=2 Tax=Bacillaceae TaxID=186817 RepID=UPI001B39ECAE|nr:glycosyl hydrolase family 28-related protein [Heyndrickxia faecalis]MBQ4910583.1 hypothetical protein [Heyndrickxia faecalis]
MRWPYGQIGATTTRAFRNLLNKVIGDIGADMQEHKDRADNIQAQVDNLVADGDSSPEAAQARVGADGTNYTTLKQRLDTENQSVTAQLAEETQKREQITYLVTDFGAVGDGVTDDTAAIQACINAAGMFKRIHFPKPATAYKITSVSFLTGQEITCDPNTEIRDYASNDYCFKFQGGSSFPDDALKYLRIKGFKFVQYSLSSLGALYLKNVYITDIIQTKILGYPNGEARGIHIEDFFQVNLFTCHINDIPNGTGIYADSVQGNSGQLNLYNTLVGRCFTNISLNGSGNLTDGINIYGGGLQNSYGQALKIKKNVNNVVLIGTHIENNDGQAYGETAVDMVLDSGVIEGVTFLNCFWYNNKYAIKSNGAKRVLMQGNQFNGNNITGSIAISQGVNDAGWMIPPQYITGYTTNILPNGQNHINMMNIKISSDGAIFPMRNAAGIYVGAGSPDGVVTANPGSIYLRIDGSFGTILYSKISGTGNTGWRTINQQLTVFNNSTRPSPSYVGVGGVIYNTDDNAPNFSDGTNWRDAMGNLT